MANRTPTAIVIVDEEGKHPGLTFEEVAEGEHKTLRRGLKFNENNGSSSWVQNDAGELPFREDPTGEYATGTGGDEDYGITWHFPK